MSNNTVRITELNPCQNKEYIETMILLVLKNQNVSLSQARGIFQHIIEKIEDENIINL